LLDIRAIPGANPSFAQQRHAHSSLSQNRLSPGPCPKADFSCFLLAETSTFCDFGTEFSNFDKLLTLFLVNLILGIAITVGFLMLIIPGIIVATLTCLSPWFVADRNMGVIESITASFDATKASFLNLLVFGVVGVAMIIVGAIPCGLGLLVVIPVLSIAASYIYVALAPESAVVDSVN
jgi:uncharacterized membrane protein